MKGLVRRKPAAPKKIAIGDNEFYSLLDAARLLGFSKSKLTKGLKQGKYDFRYGTLEDMPNATIYVAECDVMVFLRERTLRFQAQCGSN